MYALNLCMIFKDDSPIGERRSICMYIWLDLFGPCNKKSRQMQSHVRENVFIFWEGGSSRAGPGRSWNCNRQRASHLLEPPDFKKTTLFNQRLVYAKHTSSKSSVVVCMQDATFLKQMASPNAHLWVADHAIEDGYGWGNDCKCIL